MHITYNYKPPYLKQIMKNVALFMLLLSTGTFIGFRTWSEMRPPNAFEVPEGFAVEEVVSPEQAGSLVALTFDSRGRMVVAREDSTVVTLVDPEGDGSYQEIVFTDQVRTSQGLAFDGRDLLVTGVGPEGVGLYRVYDFDGDSRGDSITVLGLAYRRIEDHGAHNLFFGPDGYLYWVHGNASGIYASTSPMSPVRDYTDASLLGRIQGFWPENRTPGGKFYRKHPGAIGRAEPAAGQGALDGPGSLGNGGSATADWELFAMGFRNQYDGAFNLMGELFTFDSDMEPDLGLPWYRPTRSVHVVPGGDYGYREGSMNHPAYYFDDLPPLEETGRGSPTGVTTYQAYNYPAAYRDMVLQSDWSRGRILMGRLTRRGATYTQESDNFVYATPLNVTDVAVGPDGNVYFVLGGRRTQGGIYRVVYTEAGAMEQPAAETALDSVLTMIQPRSAFSRRRAGDVKARVGDSAWQGGLRAVAEDAQAAPERRIRALELLQVHGPGLEEDVLTSLTGDASWEVRAAAAYYLGMQASDSARAALAALLRDEDPFVQRRAVEGLLRTGVFYPLVNAPLSAVDDVFPLLATPDRFLRFAGRMLLRELNPNTWKEEALRLEGYPQATEALMAYLERVDEHPVMYDFGRFVNRAYELLRANPSTDNLLDLVRLIEVTITEDPGVRLFPVVPSTPGAIDIPGDTLTASRGGGGFIGGNNQVYDRVGELLLERFPTGDWRVDREIAKTLAALETPGAVDELAAELSKPGTDLLQQIHYAEALSYMQSDWDEAAIEQMTGWYEQMYREGRGRLRYLSLMHDDFVDHLPDAEGAVIAERIRAVQPQMAQGPFSGGTMTDIQLEERVGSLIFNPGSFDGDPELGAWAYEKALCVTCHTFGPIGASTLGPDLTTVNQRFSREDLVRSVAYPSEVISEQYQAVAVTMKGGAEVVSGTVVREDARELILQIPLGPLRTVPKAEIASREASEVSMMPEGLLGMLTNQEQEALFLLLEAGPGALPDSALTRMGR